MSKEDLDNLSIMAEKIYEINSPTEVYSAGVDISVLRSLLDKISDLEECQS